MDEPIFIMGTPRSGTTLTAKILGRHSRIFMPGETHFFDDIYSKRNLLGDPPNTHSMEKVIEQLKTLYDRYAEPKDQERITELFKDSTVQLKERLSSCGNYEEILTLFMRTQAEALGKVRWGNNAPRDLFHIDNIIDFYPEAKIIVCVRDIRDFLLSYKYKWKITLGEHGQRLKSLYHPVVTSLLWKASMRKVLAIKRYVPERNMMIIHYEHLVTHPHQVTQEICNLIGEKFEHEMLTIEDNNSSNPQTHRGIFTSSIGRWRHNLSPEETWIAQLIAGSELEAIGYSRERLNINYIKVILFFLSSPFALGRAIYANRDKRGPLLPYLIRRLSSFFQKN